MSDEHHDEHPGLIDDDPGLDYIMYSKMNKEDRQPQENTGCMFLLLFLFVPPAGTYLLIELAKTC